ncbi:3'-5' RNA nuclease TATDN2-like [Amblyomma americanum]
MYYGPDVESPEGEKLSSTFGEHPCGTLPDFEINILTSVLERHGPNTYRTHCFQADNDDEADASALLAACCQHVEPAEVSFQRRQLTRSSSSSAEVPCDLLRREAAVVSTEAAQETTPKVTSKPVKQWPYKLPSQVGLVDTHCHLDFLFHKVGHRGSYAEFRTKHFETFPDCYNGCVANFCNPSTFKQRHMWEKILAEEGVWGAFGCHPHMAHQYTEEVEEHLIKALEHSKVVALGEIGLDYSHKNNCEHEMQKRVFTRQLRLALNGHLPLIIHSRDSTGDTLQILKKMVPTDYPIHRHCFTGGWQEAQQWLSEFPNLFLGLTPLVGFSNAGVIVEAARKVPLDRLLTETDAPYFLPQSESGRLKASHPGMAIHVATRLASLRAIEAEDVLSAVRANTHRVYKI